MATGEFDPHGPLGMAHVREAVIAGLVGAVVVALWFMAVDLFNGRPLFTPAALGSALFLGARGVAEVQVTGVTVGGYTLVHFAAFIAFALLLVTLVRGVSLHPPALLGAALLLVTMEAFMIGALAILASWLLDALSLWMVLVANLLAAVSMGLVLWQRNPALFDGLRADLEEGQ